MTGFLFAVLFFQNVIIVSALFTISTPQSVVQCQDTTVVWTGGEAPFILQLMSGTDTSAVELETWNSLTASTFTWNVVAPEGDYALRIHDSEGFNAETGIFTVHAGTGCSITSFTTPSSTPSTTSKSSSPTPLSLSSTHEPTNSAIQSASKSKVAVIVGPVVAVVIVGIVAIALLLCLRRRNRSKRPKPNAEHTPLDPIGKSFTSEDPSAVTPSSHPTAFDYYSATPAPLIVQNSYSSYDTTAIPTTSEAQNPIPPWVSGAISPPSLPPSPPPSSIISTGLPPYQLLAIPGSVQVPYALPPSMEQYEDQDDEIGKFAARHRDVIPSELEGKLRRARYVPTDDPKEIPAAAWASEYGVGFFELKRLQELYDKTLNSAGERSTS